MDKELTFDEVAKAMKTKMLLASSLTEPRQKSLLFCPYDLNYYVTTVSDKKQREYIYGNASDAIGHYNSFRV